MVVTSFRCNLFISHRTFFIPIFSALPVGSVFPYGYTIILGCVVRDTADIAGFPKPEIIFVSIVEMITVTMLSNAAGKAIFKNSFVLLFNCSSNPYLLKTEKLSNL